MSNNLAAVVHDDGYFHPVSEAQIQGLVRRARAERRTLRVRGAAHSYAPGIFVGKQRGASDAIELMLDRWEGVRFDEANMQVTARAGTHLGLDPRDPTGRSTWAASLNAQLAARGWALPDLGGISHQTVAGFLATGSAGGSLAHSLADGVVAMRIVTGTGEIETFDRRVDADALAGALVSLGLFGVVSEVTFQCEPSYDIVGEETVNALGEAAIDLFSSGPDGLAAAFAENEYIRLLWWPQPGVDRLVTWKARRMQPADYDAETGSSSNLRRVPYKPFPEVLGSGLPMQAAAGLALRAIGAWPQRLAASSKRIAKVLRGASEKALAPLYRSFVPVDTAGPQRFRDTWWQGLPMDDCMEERLMPVAFLEAWLPLERAADAMERLRDHVAIGGHAASGSFVIELYPGAPSDAWLSPGYGTGPSLRVNVFCLEHIDAAIRDAYFAGILGALDDLGVRLHWGKHLYADPRKTAAMCRERLPRFADFEALRARMDPDEVFVSDYWRAHLGVGETKAIRAPAFARSEQKTARFPLLFRLSQPAADFARTASGRFHNSAHFAVTPEVAFNIFAHDIDADQWFTDLHDVGLPTGRIDGVGEIADLNYHYMTLRSRYQSYEPGRRLITVADAWSLPICSSMISDARFSASSDGGTDFEWDVYYEPLPAFAAFVPIVRPLFARLFRNTTRDLVTYFARNRA